MFGENPIIRVLSLITGFIYYAMINGKNTHKGLWMLAIPFVGMLINPIFNHNGASTLFVLNNNPVTLEAALYGLSSGIMISATLIWFSCFTKMMTSDKLLYIFGSISPKLALILSMTLRYIPLYKKQITKTNNAQKAMGLYKEENAIDKLKGGMRVFSVMVTWALENGVITADSMTARGYGVGKRSHFAIFSWTKADYILLASELSLFAISLITLFSDTFNFEYYPYINTPAITTFSIVVYVCFLILTIIPEYLQIKEEAKWKSLTSKI